MPVHNGQDFIADAIQGVERQTTEDWEMVAVLDRCTDATESIIRKAHDRRIRLVKTEGEGGLARALNLGLARCRAPLVARLDADDICEPDRLRLQKLALDLHPNLAALGSGAVVIDVGGNPVRLVRPLCSPRLVRRALLWRNPLIHPSVMFRRAAVLAVGGYAEDVGLSEDYHLWMRLAVVADLANLPQPLIRYRLHPGQIRRRRPYSVNAASFLRARALLAHSLGAPAGSALLLHYLWLLRLRLPA